MWAVDVLCFKQRLVCGFYSKTRALLVEMGTPVICLAGSCE